MLKALYRPGRRYTDEELREKAREIFRELGRFPSRLEWARRSGVHAVTLMNRFAPDEVYERFRFRRAFARAVFGDTLEEKALAAIRRIAKELGRPPGAATYMKERLPWEPEVQELRWYFGSYQEAVRRAGWEPRGPRRRDYAEDELLAVLRDIGPKARYKDVMARKREDPRVPSPATIRDYFGSWKKALEAAFPELREKRRR
ncbi:MAG: hypothetical protein KM310_00235 [Clostridiales bacterium]|nr:hypothetical protein [Clostridiales bacterium]